MDKLKLSNFSSLKAAITTSLFGLIVFYFMSVMPVTPQFKSEGFIERSKNSLLSFAFYTSDRPFTVDLFYKIFGSEPSNVVIGQQLFSAFCWTFLGFAISQTIKNRTLSFLSLLILSTVPFWWNIAGWTNVMRSESVTFSLFALWYANLILYYEYRIKILFVTLCTVTLLFSFTRDNIPYFLLLFAALLAFLPRKRHAWFKYFVFVLIVFGLQVSSAQTGQRHQFPLINVLLQRVLVDEVRVDYFISHGMPVDKDFIEKWERQWATSYDWALYKEARYEDFMDFTIHDGKYVYGLFLLENVDYTFKSVWDNKQHLFVSNLNEYTEHPPKKIMITVFSKGWDLLASATLPLLLIPLMSLFLIKRHPYLFLILPSILVNAIFIYHADAMEVQRHSLIVMTVWLTIFIHASLKLLDATMNGSTAAPSSVT